MEIRKMKTSEIDQVMELGQFAFQLEMNSEELEERKKFINPENVWVAAGEDEIYSKLTILPMEVYIGPHKLSAGGVSGVATWPEKRRNGLVSQLLAASLKDMKDRGHILSFLYPFSIPFYRKYGWELSADTKKWTIPKDKLPIPDGKSTGTIKRLAKEDWKELNTIYQSFAQHYAGAIERTEDWCKQFVFKRKKGQIAVFTNSEGKDEGYLIYQVKERTLTVHEFVHTTNESREGLWNFLANHDSMIDEMVMKAAIDDPSRLLLVNPHIKEERESYFMGRIVDVFSLLQTYPFIKKGAAVIHVTDNFCSWNDGSFKVEVHDPGENLVRRVEQGKGVACTINTLSSVLMGYTSVEDAVNAGLLTGDEAEIRGFKAMLPPLTPFLYDFF